MKNFTRMIRFKTFNEINEIDDSVVSMYSLVVGTAIGAVGCCLIAAMFVLWDSSAVGVTLRVFALSAFFFCIATVKIEVDQPQRTAL